MLAAGTGDLDLVTTLLEFDARVEDKDKDGHNAFHYAKNKKKVKLQSNVCFQLIISFR